MLQDDSPKWNFPPTNGATSYGLNGNSSDNFRGKRVESLIRKSCQNSLDASAFTDKPAIVEFSLFRMNITDIPKVEELKEHFNSCFDIAEKRNEDTWKNHFDQCKKELNKKIISCLRISDFNTTGLKGSRDFESPDKNSQWVSCVRSIGSSGGKSTNSAGSQGLGKNTAFFNSILRTVFYSTLDRDGYKASEGISNLITHMDNKGVTRQSIGYYSCTHDDQPCRAIYDSLNLDVNFERSEPGTDVYITSFNEITRTEDLEKIIKIVATDRFLPAIRNNKLVIKVGSTTIDKASLPIIIEYLKDSDNNVPKQYKKDALDVVMFNDVFEDTISPIIYRTDELGIEGQFELKLKVGEGLNKKIACYRNVGMRIRNFAKRNNFEFSGVLTIVGDKLNCFMKNMENASHDDWQPEAYTDPKQLKIAGKLKNQLNDFISDELDKIQQLDLNDQIDSGLGGILPDLNENQDSNIQKNYIGMSKLDTSLESDFKDTNAIVDNKAVKKASKKKQSKSLTEDEDGNITDVAFKKRIHQGKTRNNTVNSNPVENNDDKISEESGDEEIKRKYSLVKIDISYASVLPYDKYGAYLVRLFPVNGTKKALIKVAISAENGEYKCLLESASTLDGHQLTIENGSIVGIELTQNKETSLIIKVKDNLYKSFKVEAYAYKKK